LTYISNAFYYAGMHAFDVLGDPVRRRILELLADGELSSGAVASVVQAEFGISQPAVSQHLKVLRDSGFRAFWGQRLDSLETELARGKRERRRQAATDHPKETTR
jgi:DNA-binding transcriptional ArsR family regulator